MSRPLKPREAISTKPSRKPMPGRRAKGDARPADSTMTHTGANRRTPGWGVHQQDEP